MEKHDAGLTELERERLTGPPRDASEMSFGASTLVFCALLLICALIAGASRIVQPYVESNGEVASPLRNVRTAIIDNGNASAGGSAHDEIETATPDIVSSNKKTSDAPLQSISPMRVPPVQ